MSRLTYLQKLILNLKEMDEPRSPRSLSKQESLEQLKYHTGQDFGDNVDEWENWVNEHPYFTHKSERNDEALRLMKSSPIMKMYNKLLEEEE